MEDAQVQSVSSPVLVQIICSRAYELFELVASFCDKRSSGNWSASFPKPHPHPPNTSFLLCTICDGAWRDEGMPLVTITGMHGNPCTLPTDMPCALYSTSQYYGLSKSFKVLWKNDIFLCLFIYLILKIQQWDSHLHHWLLYSSGMVWSLRYLKIEKLWWDYF